MVVVVVVVLVGCVVITERSSVLCVCCANVIPFLYPDLWFFFKLVADQCGQPSFEGNGSVENTNFR